MSRSGGILRELAADFGYRRLPTTVAAGLLSGVVAVTLGISFAALVFRGRLAADLPVGIGLTLAGSLVIGLVTAVGSSVRGAVAGVQDNTSAVIGIAAASLAAGIADDRLLLPSVVALIVTASLLTAAAVGGLGAFRLGGLVRFVPLPVIGGFLLATGIVLIDGALTLLVGADAEALTLNSAARWIPGVALGVVLFALGRQRHSTAAPWVLMAAIGLLHAGFALGGVGRSSAWDRGWLLGPSDGAAFFRPDAIAMLGDADWGAVAGQWGALATVVVLAAVSVMIHVHALEEVSGRDFDVDRELRVAGIGAAAAGLVGGLPGSMYFADTVLLERVGGPNRGAALLSALTGGVVLLAGGAVLSVIPTAVVGGVLLSLGLAFVVEWLWDRRRRLERSDRILILVIGAAVVVFGFLEAIALGTAIAIVLFVIRYSRVQAIRHAYSLDSFRSAVDRPAPHAAALDDLGNRALVLEVHGYLFFGSAHRVFGDPLLDTPNLRYAVFDLARVSGIDSSATTAFLKLARRARSRGFEIVLAGMPEPVDRLLGPLADDADGVHRFADLDSAIEWCEDRILERSRSGITAPRRLDDLLDAGTGGAIAAGRFDRLELGTSEVLVRRGDKAPGLFFLESGSVTAWLPTATGEAVRLRTLQPGTVIGEISLYLGGEATADVVADEPSVVLHFSPEDLAGLEREDPAAAAAIHRFAACTLANRVLHAERAVRTLTDGAGRISASDPPRAG